MFEALLLRRVFKSGFLYQLCSKAYLEVLENYNEVSDAHTASSRMFAYQKTQKHPSKSDSRNSILLSKVIALWAVPGGIKIGACTIPIVGFCNSLTFLISTLYVSKYLTLCCLLLSPTNIHT